MLGTVEVPINWLSQSLPPASPTEFPSHTPLQETLTLLRQGPLGIVNESLDQFPKNMHKNT